ncbi:hypothetical protein [Actinomadura rugatobispora]|uniref:Uncharacterized protein n=1 Tax=Actinomadura rugatobispora TaxID=1994 RepID=A0ABW1A8S2_9ACTN
MACIAQDPWSALNVLPAPIYRVLQKRYGLAFQDGRRPWRLRVVADAEVAEDAKNRLIKLAWRET